MKRFTPYILLAGDMLALLLFVAIGQRDHDLVNPENPIGGALTTGAVFIIPWLIVAWQAGAFGTASDEMTSSHVPLAVSTRAILLRALNAWLIVAPLAVVLRAIVHGRTVIPTIFVVVVMGLGGAFLLGWRVLFLLAAWLLQRRTQQSKSAQSS